MFEELSIFKKVLIVLFALAILPLSLPLASMLSTFILQYEYHHLLYIGLVINFIHIEYLLLILVIVIGFYLMLVIGGVRALLPKHSIYGDARLASKKEMKEKGLFDLKPDSIILGYVNGKLAVFNEDLHAFLGAMTGSGKGVSFVIPNMLNWWGSVICIDIKRDIHLYTAWFRSKILKQPVYVFEPLSTNTDAFNPLSFVSTESDMVVDDLQKIAATLCLIEDVYFDGQARVLFVGLMQMLLERHQELGYQCSIGQVLRLLGTKEEIGIFLTNQIEMLESKNTPLSASCKANLYSFINEPEKPRGSIRSSLVNHLQLWTNPRIDRATSHSTFDFSTFRKQAQTLYLVASPNDMARLGPLFRLLFDSFLGVNTKVGEQPRDQPKVFTKQVLLLLDEFISMGVMDNVVHGLSYVRGWGIKVATVIQSPKQLESKYDAAGAEAFEDGHRARVFFRPSRANKNASTDLAEAIGKYTGKTISKSSQLSLIKDPNRSKSESDADLYLFTPDQIRNMPDDRLFIMIDGLRPIYGKKITYYTDSFFKNRIGDPPPLPKELTFGDAVYPDEGMVKGNKIVSLLPQNLIDKLQEFEIAGEVTKDNVEEIASRLQALIEENI